MSAAALTGRNALASLRVDSPYKLENTHLLQVTRLLPQLCYLAFFNNP